MTTEHEEDRNQHRVLKDAFEALLKGDTSKRDRLDQDMERARFMDAKEHGMRLLKEIDFFVKKDGGVFTSRDVLRKVL